VPHTQQSISKHIWSRHLIARTEPTEPYAATPPKPLHCRPWRNPARHRAAHRAWLQRRLGRRLALPSHTLLGGGSPEPGRPTLGRRLTKAQTPHSRQSARPPPAGPPPTGGSLEAGAPSRSCACAARMGAPPDFRYGYLGLPLLLHCWICAIVLFFAIGGNFVCFAFELIRPTSASLRPYLRHLLIFILSLTVQQDGQKSPSGRYATAISVNTVTN